MKLKNIFPKYKADQLIKILKGKTYENQEVCCKQRALYKLVEATHLARLDISSGRKMTFVSLSNK